MEIDEVYGFVGCLEGTTKPGKVADEQRGAQYAFMALDADTKLVLHLHVGKRDAENATDFLDGLNRRFQYRFQLTSDGFQPYTGRDDGVRAIFGDTIDYCVEVKRYGKLLGNKSWYENPTVCKEVRRYIKFGAPDMARCTVNHAERHNLSVRLFNRRFTRKTLGYSKSLRNHRCAAFLQAAHGNFCRTHSALHAKGSPPRTPAMAAGLTDRVWTVTELIAG